LWNGYDANTTVGAMTKASILPIAEKGILGTRGAEKGRRGREHERRGE
jgi:hypothetical protein